MTLLTSSWKPCWLSLMTALALKRIRSTTWPSDKDKTGISEKRPSQAWSFTSRFSFLLEIFLAVWWWKGIIKPGNLQITSIPQRSEECVAFGLINSAFFSARGDSLQPETSQARPKSIITSSLILTGQYQSKNGTHVSCGSFAKACGGRSLEMKRWFLLAKRG